MLNEVTYEQMQELVESGGLHVFMVSTTGCRFCKIHEPQLVGLRDEEGYSINKINASNEELVIDGYMITGAPSTLIFKNGMEQERVVGPKPVGHLLEEFKD